MGSKSGDMCTHCSHSSAVLWAFWEKFFSHLICLGMWKCSIWRTIWTLDNRYPFIPSKNGAHSAKWELWEILLHVKHTLSDNHFYREMCRFTVKTELESKGKEKFASRHTSLWLCLNVSFFWVNLSFNVSGAAPFKFRSKHFIADYRE